MSDAATNPLVPAIQARLGLAADALDLDRVRTGEAHAVEDLSDPREIDGAAVAHGREVPVFEAAAIVLEMDVSHQMLDLVELVAGIGALVVVGDVAGIEVEPDMRMVDLAHQGQHGLGVLRRPLVSFEREGHAALAGGLAEPAQVGDDRLPLGGVGRLAGARDADLDGEPARGEPDSPLGELDALARADVGPADVAAADLDPVTPQVVAKRLGRACRRLSR